MKTFAAVASAKPETFATCRTLSTSCPQPPQPLPTIRTNILLTKVLWNPLTAKTV
jgi:hypothetical protein